LSKHGIPCELHINPGCDNSHKLCKIHTEISEFIDITDAYLDYGISILTDFWKGCHLMYCSRRAHSWEAQEYSPKTEYKIYLDTLKGLYLVIFSEN
jgi:hypothetical protein